MLIVHASRMSAECVKKLVLKSLHSLLHQWVELFGRETTDDFARLQNLQLVPECSIHRALCAESPTWLVHAASECLDLSLTRAGLLEPAKLAIGSTPKLNHPTGFLSRD